MREQEVRNLWEAYLEVCEQETGRGPRISDTYDMRDAEGGPKGGGTIKGPKRKNVIRKEEVETWVNSLIEEGYDLSDYTWEEIYEAYANLNEARTDPRGRPASGPMSVYGGRGQDAGPGGSGNENVDRMDAAQRRVKATQPKKKGMAADSLFTKYSARQKGMEHGGEEGPGPNAPKRSGRSGRGANTDRGKGNAAKRRMSEDFDLFDTILEHLVAEGYADTNESALVIMANMSEEWRESIVEMNDFQAGGGNAKMQKTGMNMNQVIALGRKNLAAKSPSSMGSSSGGSSSGGGVKPGDYNININFGPKKEPKQQPQPYTPSKYSSKGPRRKYTPDAQSIFKKPSYDTPSFADMKDDQMRSQAQDSDEWLVRAGKQKPGYRGTQDIANKTIAKQRAYYGQK